ncbi:isohexenylglutaconyl-CoA hydratase [Fontimonas thermophila]|uniref:Isohexenylglutaconyl-CoA hydratase n=1 Tax=Fontimonas thermophila TaxID=1076937 RepID=A0A1I2ITI9_9GAMM|nr:enoyl-CoA hydratase-related protein [Fontimonas thermophila]SFF45742.1 isohexenylglutaconyl-CoA hydratase [Fontimonas thermophila]
MDLPQTQTLQLSLERGVLTVTLNRPEAKNALSPTMIAELTGVFDAVRASADVRAVILRGAGGHFCAGGDLKEMMAGGLKPPGAGEADPIVEYSRRFGRMLHKASTLPAVVIAICEGAVLGGGFGLACVSDIAFAHAEAKFGLPETTRGLPPAQIAPFVVERIGLTQARRLCLTGAQFRGTRALELGLVHEVFTAEDELQVKLADTLKQVLECAPHANAVTKEIILGVAQRDMDVLLDQAAHKFAACVRGTEAPEGILAFMQKRKPKWANA